MVETRIGRPRSESTRRAILEATSDLIAELGYSKLTVEAIAARAGAGKQTVYRWWSSKSLVVADAVVEGYLGLPALTLPDTGFLEADLKSWIMATAEAMSDPAVVEVVRALAVAASDDEDQASLLYARITGPHYSMLIERLRSGQELHQLPSAVDPTAVADALIGTVLFRLLARLPITSSLTGVVDALLAHPSPDQES